MDHTPCATRRHSIEYIHCDARLVEETLKVWPFAVTRRAHKLLVGLKRDALAKELEKLVATALGDGNLKWRLPGLGKEFEIDPWMPGQQLL
mmetsp:Transcript_51401/g.90766  ORF Transcript_51401/g.90766 Transcript_51401/m.90766 type:complete len:91 (+) Transcript_51401:134-406(+)